MSSLFGLTMSPAMQFIVSLAFVIVLIIVTLVLAKNFGIMPGATARIGKTRTNRLSISEVMSIDGRRKLVLLRRDGLEHLVLLGGAQDLVIETAIDRAIKNKLPSTLTAKDLGIQDEAPETPLASLNEEGYKITSWSVPATSGAAPQIHLATRQKHATKATSNDTLTEDTETQLNSHEKLRASIEDIVANEEEQRIAEEAILLSVENAREAAVEAVSSASTKSEVTLQHMSGLHHPYATVSMGLTQVSNIISDTHKSADLNTSAEHEGEVTIALHIQEAEIQQVIAPETQTTDTYRNEQEAPAVKIPTVKTPRLAAKSEVKSAEFTKKHLANVAAMNAAMEEQIRALVKMPSPQNLADEEQVELQAPTAELVANTNTPETPETKNQVQSDVIIVDALKTTPLTALDEVAEEISPAPQLEAMIPAGSIEQDSNVIMLQPEKTKKSPLELAFFSVFGEPKISAQEKASEAEETANEQRNYTDVLDAAVPKIKPKAKKQHPLTKVAPVESHPTYQAKSVAPQIAPQELSDTQFDELEMELAKLLQGQQGRG